MDINEQPLVSIISPCWNGENHIERMLNSILSQTYSKIELICVNDGSSDNTEKTLKSYIQKFFDRGMILKIFSQENQGQASAINKGLKHIEGEYLSWIDCDDFLTDDSVEKKLKLLLDNPDFSIVTSDFYVIQEELMGEPDIRKGFIYGDLNFQPNQFYLALVGMSIIESHCHMIKVKDFKKINPDLEISICRAGQNYQILLPMYYYFKRLYINEPLAHYVVRKDSHYHQVRTLEEELERYDLLLCMLKETFESMGIPNWESEKYIKLSTFNVEKRRLLENYGRS